MKKIKADKAQLELLALKTVLTVDDAASYLDVASKTVYDMCHFPDGSDGLLPHFHLGKSIRIFRDILNLWIIENTKGCSNKLLIDFQKSYINNIGRKEMKPSESGVLHG